MLNQWRSEPLVEKDVERRQHRAQSGRRDPVRVLGVDREEPMQ